MKQRFGDVLSIEPSWVKMRAKYVAAAASLDAARCMILFDAEGDSGLVPSALALTTVDEEGKYTSGTPFPCYVALWVPTDD